MSLTALFIILFILLIGLFCLTAVHSSLRRLNKKDSKKHLDTVGKLFFYRYLHQIFFHSQEYEEFFFAATFAQNTVRFFYAAFSILILVNIGSIQWTDEAGTLSVNWPMGILNLIGFFFLYFFIGDHLSRILSSHFPVPALFVCAPIASIFMIVIFPLTYLFLKFSRLFSKTVYLHTIIDNPDETKEELIEMIEESDFNPQDPHDKKLIESVIEFKDRIAREVMVPRIDVFSLEADTTIEEASKTLRNEGFSRTPVYKDTLDNIVGVLMYKDILSQYMEYVSTGERKSIKAPISSILKNVLYTPETKKISHLLQEFRKQQVHLAIVVDEYGGTEGIVTIEDILETIVGDIADEYDDQETLFIALPDGGWLVDGRMNIHELEEQLNIKIPHDGDYDTIGGFLFHETGTVPHKGFVLRKDDFEIEVIRSSDRRVEKLSLKPIKS